MLPFESFLPVNINCRLFLHKIHSFCFSATRVVDGFGRLLAARRDRGLLSATLDIIVEGAAYIKSSVQIVLELFRNLRCHLLANGDDWLFTEPTMPTSPMSTSGSPKARGRRRNAASVMAPVTSRIVTGRLPELEDLDETKRNQDDETNEESLDTTRENTNSLEPAFVKDEDYPPGWLVFDPHLGIVSKAEADRYKRDQMRKRAEHVKQQNFDTHDKQQQPQPQQKLDTKDSKCNNPQNRPLRTNNAMPKASQMHTPQTIAANG